MKTIIDKAFNEKCWAVLGANNNPNKFGNRIFKRLREEGYQVTPVNPNYESVEGVDCIDSIEQLSEDVKVLNVVVPAALSLNILDNIEKTAIEYVWFQPGTFNDQVIEKAKQLDIALIYNHCVLVEIGAL